MHQYLSPILTYHNSIYQGLYNHKGHKQGFGLLYYPNDHALMGSFWSNDQANGSTFIFYGNNNYMFGQWKNNVPNGLNVIKLGSCLIVGQFKQGGLVGSMLIIESRQNSAFLVQKKDNENDKRDKKATKVEFRIKSKSQYNIEGFIQNSQWKLLQQKDKSLINFLSKLSFKKNSLTCQLHSLGQQKYRYGFQNGLAFIFDASLKMLSMGSHQGLKLNLIGLKYNQDKSYAEGNFSKLSQIIAYKNMKYRPQKKLSDIYRKVLLQSINFNNFYAHNAIRRFLFEFFRGSNFFQILNKSLEVDQYCPKLLSAPSSIHQLTSTPNKVSLMELQCYNSDNEEQSHIAPDNISFIAKKHKKLAESIQKYLPINRSPTNIQVHPSKTPIKQKALVEESIKKLRKYGGLGSSSPSTYKKRGQDPRYDHSRTKKYLQSHIY